MSEKAAVLTVKFLRSLHDDADVEGFKPTPQWMAKQVHRELQCCYDEGFMSGSFKIESAVMMPDGQAGRLFDEIEQKPIVYEVKE